MAVATEPPRPGVRRPLLQPGADDGARRDRPARSPPPTRPSPRPPRSPQPAARTPSRCKDRAGFIVNALLFPYLNNAVRMLENGTASRDDIDTAMKGGCNFPMGPLALLDLVGLDTSLAILDALYDEFRDPNYAAVPALRRMVTAGQLGRKSGRGFYDYSRSSRPGATRPAEQRRIARRAAIDAVTGPSSRRRPRGRSRRAEADDSGVVGIGADLEPGTLLAAYRPGLFPMPVRRRRAARLVVARPPRRPPARRAARQPLAAPVVPPLRGPHRHRLRRRSSTRCADPRRPARLDQPANHATPTAAAPSSAGPTASRRGPPTASWSAASTASRIGGLFAGESMFHRATRRVEGGARRPGRRAASGGAALLDVQWTTDHLASLGAVDIPRAEYLARLPDATARRCPLRSGADRATIGHVPQHHHPPRPRAPRHPRRDRGRGPPVRPQDQRRPEDVGGHRGGVREGGRHHHRGEPRPAPRPPAPQGPAQVRPVPIRRIKAKKEAEAAEAAAS